MKNTKYTIRKELVGSPVEEWYEFRVYAGEPKDGCYVASFANETKAEAWIGAKTH